MTKAEQFTAIRAWKAVQAVFTSCSAIRISSQLSQSVSPMMDSEEIEALMASTSVRDTLSCTEWSERATLICGEREEKLEKRERREMRRQIKWNVESGEIRERRRRVKG